VSSILMVLCSALRAQVLEFSASVARRGAMMIMRRRAPAVRGASI
jgi:hypothetical protein